MMRRWLSLAALLAVLLTAPLAFSQTLNTIQPSSAVAGSPTFTLTLNGQFLQVPAPQVYWLVLATQQVYQLPVVSGPSVTQIMATVDSSLLTTPGSAEVYVTQGSGESYPVYFTITVPPPTLSSLSPNTAVAGSPGFTMIVNGANFPVGAKPPLAVTWNGTALQTTYVNSGQLDVVVPTSLVAAPGMASVTLNTQTPPTPLIFTITPVPLTLTGISPGGATAGDPSFTLTVSGSGFSANTTVTWNGTALATSFVNSATLTATVPANLVATAGSASVGVASPGQVSPSPMTFTINAPFTLTGLSPSSAVAGGPAFTLTLNGTGFTAQTTAYWNTTPLTTTFVNANQMTAQVPANLIAQTGSASITAQSSSAGRTGALLFTITSTSLTLTSISPNSAVAGSPAFNLTANGSGFTTTTVITWNGTALSTNFVSGSQLTTTVPASLIATTGQASVDVLASGQPTPAPLPFTITPSLSITSISPTSAIAGGPSFSLTVTGTGFNANTVVYWNGTPLSTTSTNLGLVATVPANLITQPGQASITAQNGNQVSNAVPFTVTPALSITSISPNTAVAGSPAVSLTVNGTGFNANTVVFWNSTALSGSTVSSTQLSATIPANLLAQSGVDSITGQNGNQVSNAVNFTVTSPGLTITSISPNTAVAGSPALSLTVTGTGFNSSTVVFWNSTALSGSAVSSTQLSTTIPANLLVQSGVASITAQNGNQVSNAVNFTITSPGLSITSISPNSAAAGSPAVALTVNGTGFNANTVVYWNSTALSGSTVSSTQLSATIPASLLVQPGAASITAQNGNQVSNAVTFTITSLALTLTSISPSSALAGGPDFTLTATGSGFTSGTQITWNGSSLSTTFVSSSQLTATVPANLIATAGTASVDVSVPGQVSPSALPFVITSSLTITSLSPSTLPAGSAAFTLSVNGIGFAPGTSILWNGLALPTTFVSSNLVTVSVPANLVGQQGPATITAQSGTLFSNALTFSVAATGTQSSVSLTSLSPNTAPAGSPALTLTVYGSGFAAGANIVTWNGTQLSTTFISSAQLNALVPASFLTTPENAAVSVTGLSQPASLPFTILNSQASLTLTSISPSTVSAGGPAFTLTVTGTGFTSSTTVTWNGNLLATTFVSATQLTAAVPASFIATTGTAAIDVSVPAGQTPPAALQLTITQGITLTSLSPNSAPAGGAAFTLTLNGTGFASGATAVWNGTPLSTTFVSATQLTASVGANLIAQIGSASVTVTSGNLTSNSLPFTITAPVPVITSISPASVLAGGPTLTLTVNGTGFLSGTVVSFNATSLSTTFVSATQVTAVVPAALTAQAGSAKITLTNPSGVASNTVTLTIAATAPVITSISPATVPAGGPAFTLTVTGTGFASGGVVSLNGTPLTTTFVSGTQVTAGVPTTFTAQPGSAQIAFSNPSGPSSNAVTLTIAVPIPVITSISPSTVVAGGPAFTLTIVGTGFLAGATASFNTSPLATTFVSATQLTAAVPANLIAQTVTAQITVANSGGTASNAVALTVTAPTPTITSISPATAPAGAIAFTVTVTGTNFLPGAIVFFNSTALNTTFVSATQLTAVVPANLITQPGTAQITVTNTVGASSNAVTLTITAPTPTITSISPSSVPQGGPAFTLTVNGTNFVSGATVLLGTNSLTTTFVSTTQLMAAVPASLILQPAVSPVTVTNPGSSPSNPIPFTVTPPTPTITSISPASVTAGGPAFTLTVTGTGFAAGAAVSVNGTTINTTVVSATQLTAQVPANLIAQPGTFQVTAANQGGAQSNAVALVVNGILPTLTSTSPISANVGGPTFTLSLTGTGFVQASIAQWNGAPLATTFVSSTQLNATVDSGRLIQPGNATVTVANPSLADGTLQVSNSLPFAINPVTPVVTSISPTSVTAGGAAFSLTVNGSGFISLTTIQWNTTTLTTHFVSATQITGDVPASLIAQTGTVTVTAVNPGNTVSSAFTLTISAPAPPVISSLSQTSTTAGNAAFTLTVTGTGFTSGAVVNFGSAPLTTTFASATQLTAAVTTNLLLAPATYQVVVQQGGVSSNAIAFTVNLPPPPSLRLNPPATAGAAQQPTIDFGLNTAYPIALAGTVTLTFASNATLPVDDPSIQFASGGRTFTFTVPANTTTLPALLIQTGTVAGVITLKVTLTAAGVDVTPTTGSSATITIAKSAPVIRTVKLIHASGYLEVDINGFSTTRDMSTAVFTLNPVSGGFVTSSVLTVPVSTIFTGTTGTVGWYQNPAATPFGSQFTYAQPFTVIGDTNQIQSVTVTLTNSAGTSVSVTSN